MLLYAFPIPYSDPLRFYALLVEWILAFICFELGVVFIVKYRRQQFSKKYMQELGYASLFFGFSCLWFSFIVGDYFLDASTTSPFLIWPRGSPRDLAISIGYFSLVAGVLLFVFLIERHQAVLFRRFTFTIAFSGLVAIYVAVFIQDIEGTGYLNFLLVAVFAVFFLAFLVDLSKRMRTRRDVSSTLWRFLVSFSVLACGYVLTIDAMLDVTGLAGRTVGSALQLGSFIGITILFLRLPPFATLDWHKQIEDIYVIDKAGVCLFQKSFTAKQLTVDKNLASSAISTVNLILKEMTSADELGQSTIKRGDKAITVFSSELVTGVVISREENYLISYNLKNFIQTFEAIYRGVLATWNGDGSVFAPAEAMAEKIFKS
ncbi:MAG: hypothetical protein JW839_18445 [Candidatus Lokiarchaeota archaeon]|nr:hypothetical protein [Candidatus Lokiarchaeota archaeon]